MTILENNLDTIIETYTGPGDFDQPRPFVADITGTVKVFVGKAKFREWSGQRGHMWAHGLAEYIDADAALWSKPIKPKLVNEIRGWNVVSLKDMRDGWIVTLSVREFESSENIEREW